MEDVPCGPVVKTLPSKAGCVGSILGCGNMLQNVAPELKINQ